MNRSLETPLAGARLGACLCALLCWLGATVGAASEVKIFRQTGSAAFSSGEADGVSIDALGVARLARKLERVATVEEPYVLAAVRHGQTWWLGTGNDGKVIEVAADGTQRTVLDAEESQVTALLAEADGTVLAATSPDGKVYRIAADGASSGVVVEPQVRYIWALARHPDGRLLLGTGTEGKLLAVADDGEIEVLFDANDPHVRALFVAADGSVLAGTAGEGLVLRIGSDGSAHTLHDAAQPEITAFAAAEDGVVYAAALASEASQVDLSQPPPVAGDEAKNGRSSTDNGSSTVGSRPASFKGARSEVLRIDASGQVESVWSFEKETVFTLLWSDRLWVGTGLEGKVYSLRDRQMVLEKDLDELQVVRLLPAGEAPVVVTTNSGAVYRPASGRESSGELVSTVLDAELVSRFGSLHWEGTQPRGTSVAFAVRSGMSPNPDATWSEWSAFESGRDIALDDVPRGRYVQWKTRLEASAGATPELVSVELSYLQANRRPEITKLEVLEPGKIIVPSNFNPGQQAFEPEHPSRDGIFTTLGDPSSDDPKRTKELWKLGYRTLEWEAKDPNQDALRYRLAVRREGASQWLEIRDDLESSYVSFDSTVLPDGVYRFKLIASDARANPEGEGLESERISEQVVVDHRAPEITGARRVGAAIEASIGDTLSPLREVEVSIDGGAWKEIEALDGLVDGRLESVRVEMPEDATLVLLRLRDAAHNVTTVDLLESVERVRTAERRPRARRGSGDER